MSEEGKNNEGGYKKPPKHSQFKKGQSGNPTGRPKSRQSLAPLSRTIHEYRQMFIETGYENINVIQDGESVSMPKLQALIIQLFNKAMSGDIRSAKIILQHVPNSMIELEKSAQRVLEVTKKLRDNEREEIFRPLPKVKTYGMELWQKHRDYSERFRLREACGEENFPYLHWDEPRHELDWAYFNHLMREQYLDYGDKPSEDNQEFRQSIYDL